MKFKEGDRVVITGDGHSGGAVVLEDSENHAYDDEVYIFCDIPIRNFQRSEDDFSDFARSTYTNVNELELETVYKSPLYQALK